MHRTANDSLHERPGPLTLEHEQALARRARDGDKGALDHLVMAHRTMVLSIASTYRHLGAPYADLVHQGFLGLLEAAHRFEVERGTRFATYARWWVRYRMRQCVTESRHVVRPSRSRSLVRIRGQLGRTRRELQQSHGGAVDRATIAAELDVTEEEVAIAEQDIGRRQVPISLDNPTEGHIAVALGPDPEEEAADGERRLFVAQIVAEALRSLPGREARIVTERHLREEPRTLRDLGRELGISRERVRQLEARALERIRDVVGTRTAAFA
jgi:RNA polymerase sigma-32 factor